MDFVGEKDDISGYAIVIAPVLYMTKTGVDQVLREYVRSGGCLVTTFFSGIADENDLVVTGGYPGRLRDILGIWVEETDALPSGLKNQFSWNGRTYDALLLCDLLHTEGAKTLGVYQEDFYAGFPAVTENAFGKGCAFYVACRSETAFYRDFMESLCQRFGVNSLLLPVPGLEVTRRENEQGSFLFLLNHGQESVRVPAEAGRELLSGQILKDGELLEIRPRDVKIIRRER